MSKGQQDLAIKQIATVSTLLRKGIAASLPVAAEQYLTVSIPGTIIDTDDYDSGGTFVWDKKKYALPPLAVQQAEAKLVDGMMPLANIMIGNTGKSVSRSYSQALDDLTPAKLMDPVLKKDYSQDLAYLSAAVSGDETRIERYVAKQQAWATKMNDWAAQKAKALAEAEAKFPSDVGSQKRMYNEWNQENARAYKAGVQACWMDWVVNGDKYNVENAFGTVDVESIMARVENSKESMRDSTIIDANGANEVYEVGLSPVDWATQCKRKATDWYSRNGGYSLDQLDAEIARLTQLLTSYKAMLAQVEAHIYPMDVTKDDPKAPFDPDAPPTDPKNPSGTLQDLKDKLAELYKAKGLVANQLATQAAVDPKTLKLSIAEAQADVEAAQQAYDKAKALRRQYTLGALMTGDDHGTVSARIQSKISTIEQQMKALKALRTQKVTSSADSMGAITGATQRKDEKDPTMDNPNGTTFAAPQSELAAPMFNITPDKAAKDQANDKVDPWTSISVSFSASDQQDSSSESSWGMKVGGGLSFGLFSLGGSASHDQSNADMHSDMANCDVSISFSAMVVNVQRSWLYAELFSDCDLDVLEGASLSPGPAALQDSIARQDISDLIKYQFPAYPTSFIVAADVVIEYTGSTSHIQKHFDSQSNSGGVSVGYGPFSATGSFHQSSSNQSCQMETTASGCKIMFQAPQIIAWVSQIVPPLPRDRNWRPLVQGADPSSTGFPSPAPPAPSPPPATKA